MENKKNKAFTLVELIVVITILAILGTIGFISLQGYSSEARDAKRLSDINNLHKKIEVELSKGTSISEFVTVTNTGIVTINSQSGTRNQGVVNFTKLKENRDDFTDNGIDYPVSYSIGGTGTGRYNFLQLATIKESTNQAVLAGNYYKIQSGDSESIILNGSGQIVTDNGNILPYNILNNTLASTPTNPNRYPGCDTDDITVGIYKVAACNVGATTASTDWTVSRGSYFQWGRNKGFAYNDSTQHNVQIAGSVGLNASTDTNNFVWSSGLTNGDWSNTDTTNNWGNTTNTSVARQGPCAPGYHVPSQTEWAGIVSSGGWGSNGTAMQSALKLPYAGYRNWYLGTWYNGGSNGYYWSSTPYGANGYNLFFNSSDVSPSNYHSRAFGFSVRCFKN